MLVKCIEETIAESPQKEKCGDQHARNKVAFRWSIVIVSCFWRYNVCEHLVFPYVFDAHIIVKKEKEKCIMFLASSGGESNL